MNYNKAMLEFLDENNCTLNDYMIIDALINSESEKINAYLMSKTDAQRIAFMNGSIRRGFLFKPAVLFDNLQFSVNDYKLTVKAVTVYEELGKILDESLNEEIRKDVVDEEEKEINSKIINSNERRLGFIANIKKLPMSKKEYQDQERLNLLVEKYIDLFPKGVTNQHGSYIRGSKSNIKNKMNDFLIKNPEYTDEQILKATEQFLKKQANPKSGLPYAFCPQSHFFIEKLGVSQLESCIENYSEDNNENNVNQIDSMFNDLEF